MEYYALSEVKPEFRQGRPILSTLEGGKIVLDTTMLSLWQIANARTFADISSQFRAVMASPLTVAAGLACLVEAGLLFRVNSVLEEPADQQFSSSPLVPTSVSAVIVAYNGVNWLPICLKSLASQTYSCKEIIVVDNGSSDGTSDWIRTHYPHVRLIENNVLHSFADAVNKGVDSASGAYLLVLNQDVKLDPEAVAHLMASILMDPNTAGVAAGLHFMRTPNFLNGIGNEVRTIGWGSDNFIGYLDLGQFDDIDEVPSICFAAALISREAWEDVGPLDEGFPMYYEDTEWSYRARLKGYHLRAAPRAKIYHAFGGQANAEFSETAPLKLQNVVYGRLRFNTKLFTGWRRSVRMISCLSQDLASIISGLFLLRFQEVFAIIRGWKMWFARSIPAVPTNPERQRAAFRRWKLNLHPRVWHGLPELTWEQVCCYYLRLMAVGQTHPVPEVKTANMSENDFKGCGLITRYEILWQGEGVKAVLRDIWRRIRWSLG